MAKIRGFVSGDTIIVEEFVLTAQQALDKEVQLAEAPDPSKVILDLPNGTSQIFDFDFTVSGNILTWNGYALETLLETGDKLRVLYSK